MRRLVELERIYNYILYMYIYHPVFAVVMVAHSLSYDQTVHDVTKVKQTHNMKVT